MPSRAEQLHIDRSTQAVQRHMDRAAQSWGYDDLRSACTYIGDPYAVFRRRGPRPARLAQRLLDSLSHAARSCAGIERSPTDCRGGHCGTAAHASEADAMTPHPRAEHHPPRKDTRD
jgi:hypothetical protein